MMLRVIGLLFFAFWCVSGSTADDYVVQKGDSLNSLASKNKVPVEVLKRANPDRNWTSLQFGDVVSIPDRYAVKPHETLYSLCRGWGLDQTSFLSFNGLPVGTTLKTGQILFVPSSHSPKARPTPTAPPSSSAIFWPVERSPRPENDKTKSVSFATTGESFRCVSGGTVVFLGEFRGVGKVLLVETAEKVVFAYGNFESASVEYGQAVTKGQILGTTSARNSQRLVFFAFRQSEVLDVFALKR